jgi:hypothetical protein
MRKLKTDQEALTLALACAIADPDEERAQRAQENALIIARGLDELAIERCKRDALALVKQWQAES